MEKRVSARAIIIDNGEVLTMFRRKKRDDGSYKEYYVMPGGGVEDGESLEETVIRELKEEYNVDIRIIGYLGCEEREKTLGHMFHCEIISGVPSLGGPELDRCSEDNYYEIKRVNVSELDDIDIDGKGFIIKAVNGKYEEKNA